MYIYNKLNSCLYYVQLLGPLLYIVFLFVNKGHFLITSPRLRFYSLRWAAGSNPNSVNIFSFIIRLIYVQNILKWEFTISINCAQTEQQNFMVQTLKLKHSINKMFLF